MYRNFRVYLFTILLILFSVSTLSAQGKNNSLCSGHELCINIASKFKIPETVPPKPQSNNWKVGALFQFGFSQMSLNNWSAGGNSSVAMNAYINMYTNYTYKDISWESRVQAAYGFIQSFEDRYKKSDDKFIIDSKFGYKAFDKIFASVIFNFKSQISNGFDYPSNADPRLVSGPLSPGYLSLGIGMDYKPAKGISLVFSPLTGSLVSVIKPELRVKYGNSADQSVRLKMGAMFKVDYTKKIHRDVNFSTTATFFSDFLGTPQNIKINWDVFVDAKVNKYISTNIRTNLIYDDDVLIENDAGLLAPRIQFKEILSIGFSYTFGGFQK
jgi:hypothetical protein